MKWRFLAVVLGLGFLCGCAQPYVMRLSNGVRITTPHKPKLKGSTYYYKDMRGQEVAIPASRVEEIAPASMSREEQRFVPSTTKK